MFALSLSLFCIFTLCSHISFLSVCFCVKEADTVHSDLCVCVCVVAIAALLSSVIASRRAPKVDRCDDAHSDQEMVWSKY